MDIICCSFFFGDVEFGRTRREGEGEGWRRGLGKGQGLSNTLCFCWPLRRLKWFVDDAKYIMIILRRVELIANKAKEKFTHSSLWVCKVPLRVPFTRMKTKNDLGLQIGCCGRNGIRLSTLHKCVGRWQPLSYHPMITNDTIRCLLAHIEFSFPFAGDYYPSVTSDLPQSENVRRCFGLIDTHVNNLLYIQVRRPFDTQAWLIYRPYILQNCYECGIWNQEDEVCQENHQLGGLIIIIIFFNAKTHWVSL